MRSIQGNANLAIEQLVERIIASGELSRQDHLKLSSTVLSEQKISHAERRKINQIFDYVQAGRLKLVD